MATVGFKGLNSAAFSSYSWIGDDILSMLGCICSYQPMIILASMLMKETVDRIL